MYILAISQSRQTDVYSLVKSQRRQTDVYSLVIPQSRQTDVYSLEIPQSRQTDEDSWVMRHQSSKTDVHCGTELWVSWTQRGAKPRKRWFVCSTLAGTESLQEGLSMSGTRMRGRGERERAGRERLERLGGECESVHWCKCRLAAMKV